MSRFDDAEFSSNPSVDVSEEMEAGITGKVETVVADAQAALKVMTEIMNDPSAATEHRLQAATFVANMAMQREHLEAYRAQQERVGDCGSAES